MSQQSSTTSASGGGAPHIRSGRPASFARLNEFRRLSKEPISGMTPGWVFCCLRGFCRSGLSVLERALKPPFDIAGDLDTPVSAFMKLAALRRASCSKASRAASAWRAIPSSASAMDSRFGSIATASQIGGERRPMPGHARGAAGRIARRHCNARHSRNPTSQACRWPVASSAIRHTMWCAFSRGSRRRTGLEERRSRAALRGAALPVGIRSSHSRHRPRSRWLRRGAPLLAARGGASAARRIASTGRDTGKVFASPRPATAGRLHGRGQADAGIHRGGGRLSARSLRALRRAITSSIRSRPIARCDSSTPRPTCITARWGMSRSWAPRPRRW